VPLKNLIHCAQLHTMVQTGAVGDNKACMHGDTNCPGQSFAYATAWLGPCQRDNTLNSTPCCAVLTFVLQVALKAAKGCHAYRPTVYTYDSFLQIEYNAYTSLMAADPAPVTGFPTLIAAGEHLRRHLHGRQPVPEQMTLRCCGRSAHSACQHAQSSTACQGCQMTSVCCRHLCVAAKVCILSLTPSCCYCTFTCRHPPLLPRRG
jgi:hypothetical protein